VLDESLLKERLDRVVEANYPSATRGGVLLVGSPGRVHYLRAFGAIEELNFTYSTETIFDLASLTKPIVTATLLLMALEKGLVTLDDRLSDHMPALRGYRVGSLTLKSLISHNSGLPSHEHLYRFGRGREGYIKAIELACCPSRQFEREIYSDLGYILLGFLLEEVYSERLDVVAERELFKRLSMRLTGFNPSQPRELIAPTEVTRDRGVVWGQVHDENAYHLGGVAGHAGLFSNAHDLHVYMEALLTGKILGHRTLRLMTTPVNPANGGVFGLGWMIRTPIPPSGNRSETFEMTLFMGDYAEPYLAFGHTGFTGTSILVDMPSRVFVVLLTNRVYPTRENTNISRFRRLVHNAALSLIPR